MALTVPAEPDRYSSNDLYDLDNLASNAEGGRWAHGVHPDDDYFCYVRTEKGLISVDGMRAEENAKFIAAANPEVVKMMIEAIWARDDLIGDLLAKLASLPDSGVEFVDGEYVFGFDLPSLNGLC